MIFGDEDILFGGMTRGDVFFLGCFIVLKISVIFKQ